MPPLSLVVCVCNQREFFERLLRNVEDCYDDLVVVHDGPDETGIGSVVTAAGGSFFEKPRAYQQEPHLPFAFSQARHDWILRFDADEFPGEEMRDWLVRFRKTVSVAPDISGYTCYIPLWNGKRAVTRKWYPGRIFLFDRRQVRFFGMAEQSVVPERKFELLDVIMHHQPDRTTYGLYNVLIRKQAYRWRADIARSLLGKPTDFACWRWEGDAWPAEWEQIRRRPLRTGIGRFVRFFLQALRSQWQVERRFFLQSALHGPFHHLLLCLKFWQVRRRHRRSLNSDSKASKAS